MSRSFVDVAPESHFPIQNLPYGVFKPSAGGPPRVGVAIGAYALDLSVLDEAGLLAATGLAGRGLFARPALNDLMAAGPAAWQALRARVSSLLDADEPALRDRPALRDAALVPQAAAELLLPAQVGDYSDFYSSRHHAANVGAMFRGAEHPLLPNWLHLPVAYHGRASSLVVGGTPVRRPQGQLRPPDAPGPSYGPTRQLDFELEMGLFIGQGNPLGQAVPIGEAEGRIFGLALVNDWSARDIQAWEYQPLGPFLAKSFATSVGAWVVPLAALEPFRVAGPAQDPAPLPYLRQQGPGSFDITLEARLNGERICLSNFRHLYWSMAQQIAHHSSGGCNLRPGDLLASGTISGPTRESRGCLLELTWRGAEPLRLDCGERVWLEDGDELTLTGWCQGDGHRVGFGELSSRVLPAMPG
jgi:fumarylacetoacetase